MGLDPQIRELAHFTVRWKGVTQKDEYGDPTYELEWQGPAECVWQQTPEVVRGFEGDEVEAAHKLFLLPLDDGSLPDIAEGSLVELPTGEVGPPVVAFAPHHDEAGDPHHLTVWLGRR